MLVQGSSHIPWMHLSDEEKQKMSNEEYALNEALHIGKSNYIPWGKELIRAIDIDNVAAMIRVYHSKKHLGADINATCGRRSFGGYSWSPHMYKHWGDTALHICIKQNKILCASALLLMNANTEIKNADGLNVNDLALILYNQSIRSMTLDAWEHILPGMNPADYHLLPDNVLYRGVEKEAWSLMMQGRCQYSDDTPKFLKDQKFAKVTSSSLQQSKLLQLNTDLESVISELQSNSIVGEDDLNNSYLNASLQRKDKFSLKSPDNDGVWVFDDIRDVVEMIRKQNRLANRLYEEGQLLKSGLSILQPSQVVDGEDISNNLNGQEDDEGKSKKSPIFIKAMKSLSSFTSLLRSDDAVKQRDGPRRIKAMDFPYRQITELSTKHNMKRMNIGNKGLALLYPVLDGNKVLKSLVFSNARISCQGAKLFANILPSMTMMQYLDLSYNAIADEGAIALGLALNYCDNLRTVMLSGNRVQLNGCMSLLTLMRSENKLKYLNFSKNLSSIEMKKKVCSAFESDISNLSFQVTIIHETLIELKSESKQIIF